LRALFVGPPGRRLSTRAVDLVTRGVAARARQELSAYVLRHTCVTNVVRSGWSAEAARDLLGGAGFDLLAMGQLRHQVLGGGPHLGNQRVARIV
jgi:site-specific recombinase XerD